MEAFVLALVAHGLIGGADVIVNHELIARIPAQPGSGPEQRLHSARELIFALLFVGLAWFEWHGLLAVAVGALLLAELVVSTVDTVLELDTRVLPVTERIAHVLLFVNFGIVIALLGQAAQRAGGGRLRRPELDVERTCRAGTGMERARRARRAAAQASCAARLVGVPGHPLGPCNSCPMEV